MSPSAPVAVHREIAAISCDDARLLVESVTDYGIFMLDPDGRVLTWNRGAERIKGYAAHEIVGRHFRTFYPAESIQAGKPEQALAVARAQGRFAEEGWRVRKDGSLLWADVVITALHTAAGELRGFAKVTRDLTEWRAAADRLRLSEERFHHLVDAATDYAIFMLDTTGHIVTWNSGAQRTKGYEAHEIIGKHFSVFYTAADRASGRPDRILEQVRLEGRYEDESWRLRKDGTRFWANVVITVLRDEHGNLTGFAKVTRDLTERHLAQENERRLLEERAARNAAHEVANRAEEASRIKDEFLATVSHELRTPLNAIVGWAAMLRQRPLEDLTAKAVEVIERNARAQAKIIEDILDVSRIITGKLRIESMSADLGAIVKESIDVIQPAASAKQISVNLDMPDEHYQLHGDPERLQQVVWNLLSNAVKFTDPLGSILVELQNERSSVVLTVADTGRGMEPEFLPYAFDRFKQADSSTTRRFGGLGLGLALVRHIVELHGGTVAAFSDGPGRGSTFTLTLPVRSAAVRQFRDSSAVAPASPDDRVAKILGELRVLVVDDDPDACELMGTLLRQAGAAVHVSNSAAEGFMAVQRFRPQVIVSDIGMPDEDGYSFVRRVRALDPAQGSGIPCIALTAYNRNEDRIKAAAAGFTAHLSKPVTMDDLITTIGKLGANARR